MTSASVTRSPCAARSASSRSSRRCSRARSRDNIAFAAELAGREPDVGALLELAGLDGSFAERDGAKLSVGEQQRAMLARALALEPRVLLLDEPTSALDAAARDAIERRCPPAARLDVSIVLVTHDLEQARRDGRAGGPDRAGRAVGEGTDAGFEAAAMNTGIDITRRRGRREPRPGRDRDRGLASGGERGSRARSRRGRPLGDPADRGRLRDPGDLRRGQPAAGGRPARVMVDLRLVHGPRPAREGSPGAWPVAIALSLAARGTLGLVVALGIFEPSRATWSRSAGW